MDVPVTNVLLEVRDISAAQDLLKQVEELRQRCGCLVELPQEPAIHQGVDAPGGSGQNVWLPVAASVSAPSQPGGPGYLAKPPPLAAPRSVNLAGPQQVARGASAEPAQQQQQQSRPPPPQQSKAAKKRKDRGCEEAGEGRPVNRKKEARAAPASLLVGVSKCKKGWRAKLKPSKHLPTKAKGRRSLGVFATPEEAARAYDRGMLVVQLQYQEKVHIMLNHPLDEYVHDGDPAVAAAAARVKARIEARSAARHCAQGQQCQRSQQAEQPGAVGSADNLVQQGGLQRPCTAGTLIAASAQQPTGIAHVDPAAPPRCAARHSELPLWVVGPKFAAQAPHSLSGEIGDNPGVAGHSGPAANSAEPAPPPALVPTQGAAAEARPAGGASSSSSGGSKPRLTPVQALRRQRWQQQQQQAAAAASATAVLAGAPTAQQVQQASSLASGVPDDQPLVAGAPTDEQVQRASSLANGVPDDQPLVAGAPTDEQVQQAPSPADGVPEDQPTMPDGKAQEAVQPTDKTAFGFHEADSPIQSATAAAASCSLGYHRLPAPCPWLAPPVEPAGELEPAAVQVGLPEREAGRLTERTSGSGSDEDDMPLAQRQRLLIMQRSKQTQQQRQQEQMLVTQPEAQPEGARPFGGTPPVVDSPPTAAGRRVGNNGHQPTSVAEPSQPRDGPTPAQPSAQDNEPPQAAACPGEGRGEQSKCARPEPAMTVGVGGPRPPPLLAAYGLDVRLQERAPGQKHGTRAPLSLAHPPKRRRYSPAVAAERPQPREQPLTQRAAGTAAAMAAAVAAGVPSGGPRQALGGAEPAQPRQTSPEVIDMMGAESSASEGAPAAVNSGKLASPRPPYKAPCPCPRGLGSPRLLRAPSALAHAGVGSVKPSRPASPAAAVLREILQPPEMAATPVIVLEDNSTTAAAEGVANPGSSPPCSSPTKPLGVAKGSTRSPQMLPAQQGETPAAAAAATADGEDDGAPTGANVPAMAAAGPAMAAGGGARVGSQQPRTQQQGAFQFQDPEAARQFKRAFTQPVQGKLGASLRAARKQGFTSGAAWEQAAQAWRQKNNPTQQELRAAHERQRAQQARPKPTTWRPAEAAAAAAGHAGPAGAGKVPPAPAPLDLQELRGLPEGERRGRYREYNQLRVAGCASFLQVLLAFKVSCDASSLKEGYKRAVRMYHPDSNSKDRLWASAEQQMECEEIMKIINDRKPASL
ncbi:hypothetical protein N2152v2_003813 [Parachlorella kessleri]